MQGLPKTQRSAAKHTWWTVGCGGAGFASTLAIMHGPGTPAAVAAAALAAVVSSALAGLCVALPDIIRALSTKKVARIKAETDAKVALEEARQRTALVAAGLEGKLDAAIPLFKLQLLYTYLHARPLLSEDMLRELLPDPRTPYEEDSKLAVIHPHELGSTARPAKST